MINLRYNLWLETYLLAGSLWGVYRMFWQYYSGRYKDFTPLLFVCVTCLFLWPLGMLTAISRLEGELEDLRPSVWEYGRAGDSRKLARRHTQTGKVEFILWKAGEGGHSKDFWARMDSSRWETFQPFEEAQ